MPLAVLALIMRNGWAPLIFILGYLYAFLIAMPVIAMLVRHANLLRCAFAGGVATLTPFLLLSGLALFSGDAWTLVMLRDLGQLFALGACGGLLFWAIAFWGVDNGVVR